MRQKLLILLILFLGIENLQAQTLDAEQIYKKVNDAVVTVYAYDSYNKILSQGSGVVLNDKGWIVTNYHVYNGCDKMVVRHNGKVVEYSNIIGVDADKDILILKIADHTFPSIAIGNSDLLNVGQKIYAIGSPMGIENTMTEGIISGKNRINTDELGFFHHYIQISAPISHGSSGGAIINTNGELIGISTCSLVEGQNLNFAIPINEIIKLCKNTASDYFKQGALDFNKRIDYDILCYKIAIALNPKYTEAYSALGGIYMAIGKYDLAITYLKKAIDIDPSYAIAYAVLGRTYGDNGDYELAINYLNKAIDIDINLAGAYLNLGWVYDKKGDNYNSKLNYEKAYELDRSLRK